MHHDGAGSRRHSRETELWEADVHGQGAIAAAPGRHDLGVHQHHALSTDAHQSAALWRVHRVPEQSKGDIPAGTGWPHSVCPVHRQPETNLQGQEETDDVGQGAIRLTLPLPHRDPLPGK